MAEDLDDGSGDAPVVTGQVAFAQVEPLTLSAAGLPFDALRGALVPGTRIQRHRRTWFMGQVRFEPPFAMGRIGFQSEGPTEVWDESQRDFYGQMLKSGVTSPFAIDANLLRIAFQLRSGFIRPQSFAGALQALLNAASPTERWRVTPEFETIGFDQWIRSVDRVTDLRIRLRRPNPRYQKEDVRRLIEGANARMAEIAWHADPEDLQGIDMGDEFIQAALEHSAKYGEYTATAEVGGRKTQWASDQEGATERRIVPADPESHEVAPESLQTELDDTTPRRSEGDPR